MTMLRANPNGLYLEKKKVTKTNRIVKNVLVQDEVRISPTLIGIE
jgi:hypothetical protein